MQMFYIPLAKFVNYVILYFLKQIYVLSDHPLMVLVQPAVSAWQLPGMILIPASDLLKLLPSTGKQYGVVVGQCLFVKVTGQRIHNSFTQTYKC